VNAQNHSWLSMSVRCCVYKLARSSPRRKADPVLDKRAFELFIESEWRPQFQRLQLSNILYYFYYVWGIFAMG